MVNRAPETNVHPHTKHTERKELQIMEQEIDMTYILCHVDDTILQSGNSDVT